MTVLFVPNAVLFVPNKALAVLFVPKTYAALPGLGSWASSQVFFVTHDPRVDAKSVSLKYEPVLPTKYLFVDPKLKADHTLYS